LWPPVKRSNFANHNKLKRQAMKVIAATMPADEIAGLREIFKSIDADGSGTITEEELSSALREKGSLLRREDLEGLLALVDQDSSGCIDYEVKRGGGRCWVGKAGQQQQRATCREHLPKHTRLLARMAYGALLCPRGLCRSSWRPPLASIKWRRPRTCVPPLPTLTSTAAAT
jgi:hypothetical protein